MESAWQRLRELLIVTGARSGLRAKSTRALRFFSHFNFLNGDTMRNQVILLVEDNADDEALTLRAFKKHHISNEVYVARDGVQAIDYVLGIGEHEGRDVSILPQVVLLDLKLPKVD